MIHLDLFSGIGGFAYAVDQVWEEAEHIFCDNDMYCQAVLRRHWPQSPIWSDIRELIANAKHSRHVHGQPEIQPAERRHQAQREPEPSIQSPFILTGGFPCQPFSQAGKRRGKSDDRFLWPEMLECIRLFKPTWVIAENVYGLLSIQQGMVFEQVCSDMEGAGYEVWPFIIPACAVNAPHRRDRIWMVAHTLNNEHRGRRTEIPEAERVQRIYRTALHPRRSCRTDNNAPDTSDKGLEGFKKAGNIQKGRQKPNDKRFRREYWLSDWKQVALATCLCRVDDGIPNGMDNISGARQRTERLKMLGNSIVPQVAVEIMRAIRDIGNKEG